MQLSCKFSGNFLEKMCFSAAKSGVIWEKMRIMRSEIGIFLYFRHSFSYNRASLQGTQPNWRQRRLMSVILSNKKAYGGQTRHLLTCLALILLCASTYGASYSGGSGEPNDPYQISTASDWQDLMVTKADWDTHFILTIDLDMNDVPIIPIGNDANAFSGVFDGNDHIVRNVDINTPGASYVGLFGYVGENGHISSLGVEDSAISGKDYVGGLVALNEGGTITDCYARSLVTGSLTYVGGLVGRNSGSITNCHATGSVIWHRGIYGWIGLYGGLVGMNEGYISNCHSTGSVDAWGSNVGGLVGDNSSGTIRNCYATGSVAGVAIAGGLAGDNYRGSISNCYAAGYVKTANERVGGLVGRDYEGSIYNCYAIGSVGGENYVGGLVGRAVRTTLRNCYSCGSVEGIREKVGGLAGEDYGGMVIACFWDLETSGQSGGVGGIGLSTARMKSLAVYRDAGWGGESWVIEDGFDYPHLAWEGSGGEPIPEAGPIPLIGVGTAEEPYQIWTVEDFAMLSWHLSVLDKHIEMMADLDLEGVEIRPISQLAPFTGIFEGNNHILGNIEIDRPEEAYVGLFRRLDSGAEIRNLVLEDISITGDYYVGGLAALNEGAVIANCSVKGSVASGDGYGKSYVGGLVGAHRSGMITDCNAVEVTVSGSGPCVGGLVGGNWATLVKCYACSSVSGVYDEVGGMAGLNAGSISDCQAVSTVKGRYRVGGLVGKADHGSMTDCHANATVSGDSSVGGLVGRDEYGDISNCSAAGLVVSSRGHAGGLVATIHAGDIVECHAESSVVTEGNYAGGFIGYNNHSNIADCRAVGSVVGTHYVGGFAGDNHGGIVGSQATGSADGNDYVGGLVGYNGEYIADCRATGSANGSNYVGGLVGSNRYASIVNCHAAGPADGNDYVGGLVGSCFDGTIDGSSAFGPVKGNSNVGGLTGHIITGYHDWLGDVMRCYAVGVVDGNSHVGGLVGHNVRGTIVNCYGSGAVTATTDVGGLVGLSNDGTIIYCYADGSVTGGGGVGGLVGTVDRSHTSNYLGTDIRYSCAIGSVAASGSSVGGLVGSSGGLIADCYAVAPVTSDGNCVGGLVGCSTGLVIAGCYAGGSVSGNDYVGGLVGINHLHVMFEDSFWDVNSAGTETSEGGTGMPTVQMQSSSTYMDAGWDFVNTWAICEGTNYPLFLWQIPDADFRCPDGVSGEDFALFALNWQDFDCNSANDYCDGADFDVSGGVDGNDLVLFSDQWLSQTAWSDRSYLLSSLPSAASEPNPPDGSVEIRRDAALSWQAGEGALYHEVYFGTINPPTWQERTISTTYSHYVPPREMYPETTYYWRVDEVNPMGVTEGEVWTFTTGTSGGTTR